MKRRRRRFTQKRRRRPGNDQLMDMLDMRRIHYFKYDAKQIFNSSEMDEKIWVPLLSSIVAKASRSSITDAQDFVKKKKEEKVLSKDIAEDLYHLLEKFKKWR